MPKVVIQDSGNIKKVYFVGIKGVGMTSLAVIAKEAGFEVRGSDVSEEFLTDSVLQKKNIPLDIGFEPSNIEQFIGGSPSSEILVITTAANSGLKNPQCVFASEKGIQILTHGQAVGYFMTGELFNRDFIGVSVLGCHGKTTITGMVATALENLHMDPSYSVGTSELFPLGPSGHLGSGQYFVAEADEFVSDMISDRTVKFLYQYPQIAIMNNIDFDHPDVFENMEEVKSAFEQFAVENVLAGGTLIVNGDDENILHILNSVRRKRPDLKIILFGENEGNNIRLYQFEEKGFESTFQVVIDGQEAGVFELSVPGYHNAKNALSVIALLSLLGENFEDTKTAVKAFQGTKRRQEKVGKTKNGAEVIDDYAHHPDEIVKTIEAVKNAFPSKKIIAVFQPHTIGRTTALEKEFSRAFKEADTVIFLPIFPSKREGNISYEDLYKRIQGEMEKNGINAHFLEDKRTLNEKEFSPYASPQNKQFVVKYIASNYDSENNVILSLGAGDIYKIAYDLANKF